MGQGKHENLSGSMAILSLVNGMIGGIILILPLYALQSGYILSLLVIIFSGAFNYYSCYLCMIHLGDQNDLDSAILRHFNGKQYVKILYDIFVWVNLILINILNFELIVTQWIGLVPPYQFTWINPVGNAIILVALVFLLTYFELGASLMAYGVISIASYLIFLIWVAATSDQGYEGSQMRAFGGNSLKLAAGMGGAFSIQAFFIPVVKKAAKPNRHLIYVLITYVIGILTYEYIGLVGSIGIQHREYIGGEKGQLTIEGYFKPATWEVNIIEAIYLVHLYSVFPELLLISKTRMFNVLKLPQSQRGHVTIPEVLYIVVFIGACLGVGYFMIDVGDIITFNGGVIGFFFVYFIPATLHIKCLYFSKGKRPMPNNLLAVKEQQSTQNANIQILGILGVNQDKEQLSQTQSFKQPLLGTVRTDSLSTVSVASSEEKQLLVGDEVGYSHFYCNCDLKTYPRWAKVLDWLLLVVMMFFGTFIMGNSIYTLTQ